MLGDMNEAAWKELWASFGGVDEPAEESGRGMRVLLSELGGPQPDRQLGEWPEFVKAAADAGTGPLLARIAHPDAEARRVVLQVLAWCWADAREILPVLWARLESEPDAPARVGLVLAAGRLSAVLPDPAERAAAERRLTALLAPATDPAARFAAALGLAGRADDDDRVLTALVETMVTGGADYEKFWGWGWDNAFEAAIDALAGSPLQQAALLVGVKDVIGHWRAWTRSAARVVSAAPGLTGDLLRALAALLGHESAEVRRDAIFHLGALPGEVLAAVADELAGALVDSDPQVRRRAVRALARTGDPRCAAPLTALLEDGSAALDREGFEGARGHAVVLLPVVRRRLSEIRPIRVEFLGGGHTRAHGGMTQTDYDLVAGLATWGPVARPALPELERLLGLYTEEAERCRGRVPDDYYPLRHGLGALRRAIARIGGQHAGVPS
jgi:HEAT repeat protein